MDLLTRLKNETRPHHDRIEAVVDPMRPGLTRDEYAGLVARFHGFYASWEPAAEPHFSAFGDFFARRRKLPLLRQDLRSLELSDTEIGSLPVCPDGPPAETFSRALGTMYVVEGSTLGGQVITRHLGRTLGFRPDSGCAFFASYGDQVGPMWQEFRRFLVDHGGSHEYEIVAAAAEAFECLTRWMSRAE
jgi:heme oxygenase